MMKLYAWNFRVTKHLTLVQYAFVVGSLKMSEVLRADVEGINNIIGIILYVIKRKAAGLEK